MGVVAMAAALIFLTAIPTLHAQERSSLTDFESSSSHEKLSVSHDDSLDPCILQEKLVLADQKIKLLSQSLSQANIEAEILKRQNISLLEKVEVLGLNSVSLDPKSLESKLLSSVSEVRVLKNNTSRALSGITSLSESLEVLLKTTKDINPQVRLNLEIELRNTIHILSSSQNKDSIPVTTLNEARVIDIQENTELIVANVGASNGVKLGMTFSILRNNKKIASAYVIDVREKISGATIQNLTSESVQVENGDILQVDLNK
ncbi:MAG: hypothetical protein B9S31_00145 [Spartobacteria bacterium Tous-C9RFEB]|nr:MAG: hypothetical protein B9S31_00145 [Spartobacteria bacterium Tous-C9RFEB]